MANVQRMVRMAKVWLALLLFIAAIALFFSSSLVTYWAYVLISAVAIYSGVVYFLVYKTVEDIAVPEVKEWPTLSIVVPSFNSGKTIDRCLKSVLEMEYPKPVEVIVIDDASTDGSYERVCKIKGIRVIRKEKNKGKAAALNMAIGEAKGELVACIDSDTYPGKDALLKMVPYFYRHERVGAVTVFITVSEPGNLLTRVQELEYYSSFGFSPKLMAKINGLMVTPGPISIYKKSVLKEIGGFDEENMTEDMEIGLRLQHHHYRIECCGETHVPTEVPDTLTKLYRQRIRWYRGTLFNLKKYKHMLLNRDYSDFGMFSYPACFVFVIFTMVTFGILFYRIGSGIFYNALTSYYWLSLVGTLPPIHFGGLPALFNSTFIFLLISMGIWGYMLSHSMKMAKRSYDLKNVLATLTVITVYPAIISFFYFISLVKELNGSEFKW